MIPIGNLRCCAKKISTRNDIDEGGILKKDDGLCQQYRQHIPKRLRQDNIRHRLAIIQPDGITRRHLTLWNRLNSRPHNLAIEGRLKQRKRDQGTCKGTHLHGLTATTNPAANIGNKKKEPEDHQYQRQRPHEIDIAAREARQNLDRGQAHQSQYRSQCNSAQHRKGG